MASLKEATQNRRSTRASSKAPKSSAPKFTKQSEPSTAISTVQPTAISATQPTAVVADRAPTQVGIAVPGLTAITPDQISGMMPQFDHNAYHIADPLHFPENLPQLTEVEFDHNQTIGEGTIRALKSTGLAFDVTREKFVTEGKKAKAFGAGIQTATEFEKVRGNYLDYLTQNEIVSQKATGLDVSRHKTTVDANIAVYSKDELNQKQELARLKAENAKAQVSDAQSKLTEFQKTLGLATAAK